MERAAVRSRPLATHFSGCLGAENATYTFPPTTVRKRPITPLGQSDSRAAFSRSRSFMFWLRIDRPIIGASHRIQPAEPVTPPISNRQ